MKLLSSPTLLHRYVAKQFLIAFSLCLLTAISLFLVFDLFERSRIFIKEGAAVSDAVAYMLFKIPLIVQLMMPISVLIGVLVSIGRLSQLSEITAMRACGVSVLWLARPLLIIAFVISILMFVSGESVVPWSTNKVEEIYHLNIKRKLEKGELSRSQFWYRTQGRFFKIALYDSRAQTINGLTIITFDPQHRVRKRVDASRASWKGDLIGWVMTDVAQTIYDPARGPLVSRFTQLPLVIEERPEDFYRLQRKPETMNYWELGEYIKKLESEGVPTSEYVVKRSAKLSFPFVNLIAVLVSFPFALSPARSGTLTLPFIAGVSIGFGYHVFHAFSLALGAAELIPIVPAAWSANIVLGCIGAFLIAETDYR